MSLEKSTNNFKHKKKLAQSQLSSISQKTLKNLSKVINKKTIESIALECKLIQRTTSKITGIDFLTSMLVSSLDTEHATLEKISDTLHSVNPRIKIKPQSIMERLNSEKSSYFFKLIFEEILKTQLDNYSAEVPPELLAPFTKVLLQDSSSMDLHEKLSGFFKGSGGRASKATAKVDVIYDLKAKRYERIKLTDHGEADQKLALDALDFLTPNSLIIRDLGYLRMNSVIQIEKIKAYFLSRLKNNTCIYLNKEDDKELDFGEYLFKNCRKENVVEMNVYITQVKVPVRLVAYKVPEEIAAQRRRKAHATALKQGRTLSKKSLILLDFSIFITNVPQGIWPAKVIGTIYRLRWQIELLYKSWKSGLKIDYLNGINPNRIKSLIYVRLIMVLIINEIYKLMDYIGIHEGKVVSMHKVYNWIKSESRLKRILKGKFSWWEERSLGYLVALSMSKQKRNKGKTTLQSIYEGDFYYQEAG